MDQHITSLFREWLGANQGPTPRLDVVATDDDNGRIQVRITFARGVDYCCFEQGCHMGLTCKEEWLRFRALCGRGGLALPETRVVIDVEGMVVAGARCRATGFSDGFNYTDTLQEPLT